MRSNGIDDAYVSQRRHWEDQPRDPKGTDTGGQWTIQKARSPMKNTGKIEDLKNMIKDPEKLVDFIVSLIGEDFEGTVGLRGLYEDEGIGKLRNSYVWEDGNRTDEKLDGTSVVGLSTNWSEDGYKELESAIQQYASEVFKYDMYGNSQVGLVVGKAYADYGNDYWSNEVIVEEAKVIYIWQ